MIFCEYLSLIIIVRQDGANEQLTIQQDTNLTSFSVIGIR